MRRAVAQGALRVRRPRPRQLRLEPGEREYLREHWQILGRLRAALRTERRVRLAVLYGSVARGDEDKGSDLDLLVALADARPLAGQQLANRLERVMGRKVDVARLDLVEKNAPLLLDQVLDEGRVVIDRDRLWAKLRTRRRAIRARAQRAYRRQMDAAARAITDLTG